MSGLFNFVSRTHVLWTLAVLFLLLTGVFVGLSHSGFPFIDFLKDPAEVRAAIAAMSPEQRQMHSVLTATLDVAYPLSFGLLFAGLIWRFFGPAKWLALVALLVTPVDIAEGAVQIMALGGDDGVIDAKALVTPLKNMLFLFGFVASLIALGIGLFRRSPRAA
jgi:hypothetical protein